MSSGIPSLTILSEEQKFNGDNLLKWTTMMTQLLGSKGLLGYVDGKVPKPTSTTTQSSSGTPSTTQPTPIYSSTPTLDEWEFRDQLARGHITLNCTDTASLGVETTKMAKDAWESIQAEWGKSTDMRRSHAQELLNQTVFVEGTDIQDHIKLLRARKVAVDNLSTAAITDEAWRGVIIQSIPPTARWLPVIPSLYTMTSSADVVSTLLAHGMILDRGNQSKPTSGSSNTALATRVTQACTNPNCKAKKRSTHTTENCYWPGGGKEGQFPPNFGQRSRANTALSTHEEAEHFVLSVRVPDAPGESGVILDDCEHITENSTTAFISKSFQSFRGGKTPTFMDSGASNMMFVSRDTFIDYKSTAPRTGNSAKAEDGNFDIVGEGRVVQHYLIDGKAKNITYTCALHTPSLNANLISVSAFDKAGLTTTFGGGHGIIRKPDGTVVLTARLNKGMYVVDPINSTEVWTVPIAMNSLSKPIPLEQWHCRFSHCSPLTIQEISKASLDVRLVGPSMG